MNWGLEDSAPESSHLLPPHMLSCLPSPHFLGPRPPLRCTHPALTAVLHPMGTWVCVGRLGSGSPRQPHVGYKGSLPARDSSTRELSEGHVRYLGVTHLRPGGEGNPELVACTHVLTSPRVCPGCLGGLTRQQIENLTPSGLAIYC